MKRLLLLTTLLFASLAAAAGAYHDRDTDSRGVFQVIAKAPAKARDQKNPYKGQPDAVAAGEKLFRQHCAECHGEDAQGRGRAANLRLAGVQNATPGELAWFLRSGNLVHGMPPWAGIPEQRRWQIITYLKSLGIATNSDASVRNVGSAPSSGRPLICLAGHPAVPQPWARTPFGDSVLA
jgi:mono/diheme cytochrome c family protein